MDIRVTIREMSDRARDFNELCSEIGLNPWCMNEGLATGDEVYTLDEETAKRHGLLRD